MDMTYEAGNTTYGAEEKKMAEIRKRNQIDAISIDIVQMIIEDINIKVISRTRTHDLSALRILYDEKKFKNRCNFYDIQHNGNGIVFDEIMSKTANKLKEIGFFILNYYQDGWEIRLFPPKSE